MSKTIQELAAAQAEYEDYTKESSGGDYERELPAAGICLLRFREYIELGLQKAATKAYPNKKPCMKARFVFELTTPRHQIKYEDSEGNEKILPHVMSITCPISKSGKSNYMKLFKLLNYKGAAKVPAQCLGQGYKAEIVHAYDKADLDGNKPKDGAKPKWANLSKDGAYTIQPPRKEPDPLDPDAKIVEIPVPELTGDLKLFLWNMPTRETWDSLFIDGTYTKEIDGKEQEVSKNWLQNTILEALDYEGSKLHEMLAGAGDTLDDLPTSEDKVDETEEKPKKGSTKGSKKEKKETKDEDELNDLLGV